MIIVGENSYVDIDFADDYFANRFYTDSWQNASSAENEKEVALIWACNLLDYRVKWYGVPTEKGQSLSFPRRGLYQINGEPLPTDTVPKAIKNLQCELALHVLDKDPLLAWGDLSAMEIEGLKINFDHSKITIPPKLFAPVSIWGILIDNPQHYKVTR
jgi:hypothetical protein